MGFICGHDGTGDVGGALMWGSNARQTSGWGGTSNWKYIANEQAAMYQTGDGKHRFFVAGAGSADATITWNEAVNIDNSGNLLVATTSTSIADDGFRYNASSGWLGVTRNAGQCLYLNRRTSDGNILDFRKDNSTVGSIGTLGGHTHFAGTSSALRIVGNEFRPCDQAGNIKDNAIDLGGSNRRFNDAYITNGVTTGSDFNDKQNIETLSDAEVRVATACKGLLRKWKWKSAVAEKGDNARTHFGIIAQDLQDAFTAEGLDAGDYAMFMSNTWWEKEISVDAVVADEANGIEAKDAYTYIDTKDEATEGYTEKTRLGVRYSELLAFIISAI